VAAVALALALAVQRVHLQDPDAEDLLHGVADLDAIGVGVDDEGVDAGLHQRVGLLADYGLDDHVAGVFHQACSSAGAGSDAAAGSTLAGPGPCPSGATAWRRHRAPRRG